MGDCRHMGIVKRLELPRKGLNGSKRSKAMWTIKHFANEAAQEAWIAANEHRCQIVRLFVNNGYAVEWRKLRVIG